MTLGIPELLAIILGTGGLAVTITSIVQARRAIREGARTDERGVLADSERWRRAADDARAAAYRERDQALTDRDWYRDHYGILRVRCMVAGVTVADLPPSPPRPPTTSEPRP